MTEFIFKTILSAKDETIKSLRRQLEDKNRVISDLRLQVAESRRESTEQQISRMRIFWKGGEA